MHLVLIHEDGEGISLAELYEQFRAVITQLSVCSAKLGRLPANCTFTLMVEITGDMRPPNDVSFPRTMHRPWCCTEINWKSTVH